MKHNKYGMVDYYKFFKEQYPDINISPAKFNKIVSDFNRVLAKDIIDERGYKLPFRLGDIQVVKQKHEAYICPRTGELKNNIPVNWKATKDLWEKDPEMKKNKVIIRHTNHLTGGYVFRIRYNSTKAVYKNKSVYKFKAVRSLTRALASRIQDYSKDKYDTYLRK